MYKFFIVLSSFIAVALCVRGNPSDVNARTSKYTNAVHSNGIYNFEYESSNGIEVTETGVGSSVTGSYGYISPEGQSIQVSYVADENGYRPQGDHLPTPAPIPDYILKSLAYIESHPFPRIALAKK